MATRYNYTGGIVTNGLVQNLDAAKLDSYPNTGSAWFDISGNNKNATLTNGPIFTGVSKQASIAFDGSDDYATFTPCIPQSTPTYTIEAWWKADSFRTQVIWEQNTSWYEQGRRSCMLLLSNGNGGFNGESADFHNEVPYSVNTWYQWVITIDTNLVSNIIKLYRNGSLYTQGNPYNNYPLNIGAYYGNIGRKWIGGELFDGNVAITRAYNRVLTAAEVSQNFNAVRGRFGI